MKYIIIPILFVVLQCNAQIMYKLNMNVTEVYIDSTLQKDNINVIWGYDIENNFFAIWDTSYIILYKRQPKNAKLYRKWKIITEHHAFLYRNNHTKYFLYITEDEKIYSQAIMYISNGILIYLNRLDGNRLPTYLFTSTLKL
jgi:hypothetical protein